MSAYLGLFFSAFLAATLVPAWSEVLFAGMLAAGYDPVLLLFCASLGNSLGSVVNWALGRYLLHFQDRRWFPFRPESLGVAQRWYARWGVWTLLMAWLPIGGDALTFIAGMMRLRFWLFFTLTAVGKTARYAILLAAVGLVQ